MNSGTRKKQKTENRQVRKTGARQLAEDGGGETQTRLESSGFPGLLAPLRSQCWPESCVYLETDKD